MSDPITSPLDDTVQQYFGAIFAQLQKMQEEINARTDGRIENVEKTVAVLMSGYTELAAMVQSLIGLIISKTPEELREFDNLVHANREKMFETLQNGIKSAERDAERFVPYSSSGNEGSEV